MSSFLTLLTLCLTLALPVSGLARSIELPDIGQSGGASVSPEEEYRTGEAVMRNLRRAGKLLEDPLLDDYLNHLGYRLVAAADNPPRFRFFLVDDRSINAFALPGGFIGINSGLFLATETESELASVVAHEIAHVTQRHHARAYEFANQQNIPVLAAMIAAILLGAQGDEVGQAALSTLAAGSIQSRIDFTRENEKEADYIGIGLLADSGYDPHKMADFFAKLSRESRLYGPQAPEFLRTHPVSESRIADAANRAAQTRPGSPPDPQPYYLMRARLRVLAAPDKAALVRALARELEAGRYANRAAAEYGYALALMDTGDFGTARPLLAKLHKADPARIAYRLARAELELRAGRTGPALTLYRQALAEYPGNVPLTLACAEALLQAGQAQQARELIQRQQREARTVPRFYQLLAEAEARLDHPAASHVAMGEYYYRIGQTHQAIDQLSLALKQHDLDFYTRSRTEARLQEFKTELALLEQAAQ